MPSTAEMLEIWPYVLVGVRITTMLLSRRSEAHFPHKLQHGGNVSLHTFFFERKVLDSWSSPINQSTPSIFSNGKKQGMGRILITTLTPPQRKSTDVDPDPPPAVFLQAITWTLWVGRSKGLASHGELAPHNSPSHFGNLTTPKGPGTEIDFSYLHGNSKNL